eukprot:scaffold37028_cov160-Amphora_coffeaeformis.AAC.1
MVGGSVGHQADDRRSSKIDPISVVLVIKETSSKVILMRVQFTKGESSLMPPKLRGKQSAVASTLQELQGGEELDATTEGFVNVSSAKIYWQ